MMLNALINSLPSVIAHPAIAAFQNADPTASKTFHKLTDEPHKINFIKKRFERLVEASLQGGITGIVTSSIAITICGSGIFQFIGENLCAVILVIGLAVLIANGFSLAYNDYLKRTEYSALYYREKRREKWECDNYIEGEQREMVELYIERGLTKPDAETVIKILSKDKSFFVELMMKEELQMIQPDETISALKNSLVLFLATVIIGTLPLFPYFAQWFLKSSEWSIWLLPDWNLVISLSISLCSLFTAGVIKSSFTVTSWWMSGFQLVLHGLILLSVCIFSTSFLQNAL